MSLLCPWLSNFIFVSYAIVIEISDATFIRPSTHSSVCTLQHSFPTLSVSLNFTSYLISAPFVVPMFFLCAWQSFVCFPELNVERK